MTKQMLDTAVSRRRRFVKASVAGSGGLAMRLPHAGCRRRPWRPGIGEPAARN